MSGEILLREVLPGDLPAFYEHQRDPEACRMADFPSREEAAFMAHWDKIMKDGYNFMRTILYEGQVAGNVVSFIQHEKREVGYWLGREFWGKGIATRALQAFLDVVTERPLYAFVARHNLASRRVLEKCGFRICEEKDGGFLLKMDS